MGEFILNIKKYLEGKKTQDEFEEYETILKKSNELNTNLLFRQYIYSFLVWLHEQNPEYAQHLSPEEVSNYFLNEIRHPKWFVAFSETLVERFKLLYVVNEYISKYFGEDIFDAKFEIHPKNRKARFSRVKLKEKKHLEDFAQLKLQELGKSVGYELTEEDFREMREEDMLAALFMFSKIKALKDKKGK